MTSSNDGEDLYEEVRVLTKQEEITILKARQTEQTDPVQKLYAMYDVVVAELASVMAVAYDESFMKRVSFLLEKLDLNRAKAQNWIDNGRDPRDFYLISCHNSLNNMGMILVEVESRAIREGIVELSREPTIPELIQDRLRRKLMEEADGRER